MGLGIFQYNNDQGIVVFLWEGGRVSMNPCTGGPKSILFCTQLLQWIMVQYDGLIET